MPNKTKNTDILTDLYLKKYNLTIKEFLLLYAIILHKGSEFSVTLQSLLNKNLIHRINPLNNRIVVNDVFLQTEFGDNLLKNCLFGLNPIDNSDIEALALKMKELFPKGSKSPGHPWRSNTKEIIDKLKRFKVSYDYSDDQILEATSMYVRIMQDSPFMRTLKHFIIKKVNDEIISDLASFIENDQQTLYDRFNISYRPEFPDNQLELF